MGGNENTAIKLESVLISNGITITVEFLPSALDKLADQESCSRVNS